MNNYDITGYTEKLIQAYKEPMIRIDGLERNPYEIIRTVEFYSQDKYLSGQKDSLGRDKPFINHGNSRVRVAKTATDIDLKDIVYTPDSLKDAVKAMLINKEMYKYLKEINFSKTLNDMGLTRPKYGGVLVKRYDGEKGQEIHVCDWVNVVFDPSNIKGGAIIETHYLDPSELIKKRDVWNSYDDIDEVIEAHAKFYKHKPVKVEVQEISGEFQNKLDPDYDGDDADYTFSKMCFYMAVVGKKRYLLYKEAYKGDKYKYLAWEAIGDGLGRGVWEEGFESQTWINDQYIGMKNAMDLAGKSIIVTSSKKLTGNAVVGVDTGHIINVEPNTSSTVLNLAPSALVQFQSQIEQFSQEYNRIASTFDANTGEQPPSGTPLGQTQILNQVANSPFQYQQEVWGIWLNEILNDWIFPEVKKRIMKEHYLVSEFTDEELDIIDKDIATEYSNGIVIDKILGGEIVQEGEAQALQEGAMQELKKKGKKREINIPKGYLDIEGKLTANITGEMKNKGAILQSLDSVLRTVISSFNPNTGKYGVLEDPVLRRVFSQAIEIAGIPFSSSQLGGSATGTTPTSTQVDLTSMQTQGQPAPQMA